MKTSPKRRPRAAAVASLALWALAGTALAQSTPATAPAPVTPAPAAPAALSAADVAALARTCINCHGAPGHPTPDLAPLYGLPAPHLQARMLAFKADQVPGATLMPRLMRGYSPEQIKALAAWLSTPPAEGAQR